MCRILALESDVPVALRPWIRHFARACRESPEYQGHGWGVTWMPEAAGAGEASVWRRYRSTTPIWDDEAPTVSSRRFLVHARSAFRDEGIAERNNMPFLSGDMAFAFNGELRGVRLSVPGETGAARLLRLLERFRSSSTTGTEGALERLDRVVTTRAEYVRALNVVVMEEEALLVHSRYSEDPAYFGMHRVHVPGLQLVSSMALKGLASVDRRMGPDPGWTSIPSGSTLRFESTTHRESIPRLQPSGRERPCSW